MWESQEITPITPQSCLNHSVTHYSHLCGNACVNKPSELPVI